jgi:hypothetical protein
MSSPIEDYRVVVTFDPKANPSISVDQDPLHVRPGLAHITWTLVGPGEFASNGIEFPGPKKRLPKPWPGTPSPQGAKTFVSDDLNDVKDKEPPVVYPYTINIVTADGQTVSLDPDVANDPPPPPGGIR